MRRTPTHRSIYHCGYADGLKNTDHGDRYSDHGEWDIMEYDNGFCDGRHDADEERKHPQAQQEEYDNF